MILVLRFRIPFIFFIHNQGVHMCVILDTNKKLSIYQLLCDIGDTSNFLHLRLYICKLYCKSLRDLCHWPSV